jgi:phenylpropionate dioxygenase-like ring-hydroxylating dioxygenase large terminal subunit
MLSAHDNEILCRVGPGTAMGNLFREYWIPTLKSEELPSPDCPPIRVRMLGENLIAFRATSGKVGFVANSCPHRGASLFFGRNEEEGLRCVYHGWKFDVNGNCVDMPSEPAESNFKNKVKAIAYPAQERCGVIWLYMGTREVPPPLPEIEGNMVVGARASKIQRECNYMQALEGDIDTVHAAFLHGGHRRLDDAMPGSSDFYIAKNRDARYSVLETDFGTSYGGYRPAEEDTTYWRIANFIMPFYTQVPPGILGENRGTRVWVPLDDDHTMYWSLSAPALSSATQANFFGRFNGRADNQTRGRTGDDDNRGRGTPSPSMTYLPDDSSWLGTFRITGNRDNDYLINREDQKNWVSYTGMDGGAFIEDQCVTESMGTIYMRNQEHLGTSDSMIIRTRRRLINAALAHRDEGVIPPTVDTPSLYRQRSGGVLLPRTMDWWEGTKDLRTAFVQHTPEGMVPTPLAEELRVAPTPTVS